MFMSSIQGEWFKLPADPYTGSGKFRDVGPMVINAGSVTRDDFEKLVSWYAFVAGQ